MGWPVAQCVGSVLQSPALDWYHHDSLAVWARTMSSSMPHLHDAHWMISSVVPVKLPVTRPYSPVCGFRSNPLVALNDDVRRRAPRRLGGRPRRTARPTATSPPTGRVPKCCDDGRRGRRGAVVVGASRRRRRGRASRRVGRRRRRTSSWCVGHRLRRRRTGGGDGERARRVVPVQQSGPPGAEDADLDGVGRRRLTLRDVPADTVNVCRAPAVKDWLSWNRCSTCPTGRTARCRPARSASWPT